MYTLVLLFFYQILKLDSNKCSNETMDVGFIKSRGIVSTSALDAYRFDERLKILLRFGEEL